MDLTIVPGIQGIATSVNKLNKSTAFIGITQIILAIAMIVLAGVQIWIQLKYR